MGNPHSRYASKFKASAIFLSVVLFALSSFRLSAQSLGYEGPTGVFVTPVAYSLASPASGLGKPAVAYHFLDAGSVVGTYSTVSVTEGFAKRFELGYTGVIHSNGDDKSNAVNLSSLWNGGYSIVHGKANVIPENMAKQKWIPAVALGGILRVNDNNVGNGVNSQPLHDALGISTGVQSTTNGDVYVVATKTITQFIPKVPVLLSGGVRGTNAVLWGIGGNAPEMTARGFGTAAFVFTLPGKTALVLAAEVSQQPQHLAVHLVDGHNVGVFDIPTSLVYAVRVVPGFEKKLSVDVGVLQAAGSIGSSPTLPQLNVNLKARSQFALGISYAF